MLHDGLPGPPTRGLFRLARAATLGLLAGVGAGCGGQPAPEPANHPPSVVSKDTVANAAATATKETAPNAPLSAEVDALRKDVSDALDEARTRYDGDPPGPGTYFAEAAAALAAADALRDAGDFLAAQTGYARVKARIQSAIEEIQALKQAAETAQAAAKAPADVVGLAFGSPPDPSPELVALELKVLNRRWEADRFLEFHNFKDARKSYEALKTEAEEVVRKLKELVQVAQTSAEDARRNAQEVGAEATATADWVAAIARLDAAARKREAENHHEAHRDYLGARQGFEQAAAKAVAIANEAARKLKVIDDAADQALAALRELRSGLVGWASRRQSRPLPGEIKLEDVDRAVQFARANLAPPILTQFDAATKALNDAQEQRNAQRLDEARDRFAQVGPLARRAIRSLKAIESPIALRSSPDALSLDDVKAMAMGGRFHLPPTMFALEPNPKGVEDFPNVLELKTTSGDEVVVDHATGLMWTPTPYIPSGKPPLKEAQARDFLKSLNDKGYAGFKDWRLPTLEELCSLIEVQPNSKGRFVDDLFDRQFYPMMVCWSSDKCRDLGPFSGYWGIKFNAAGPSALLEVVHAAPGFDPTAWVLATRRR